MTPAKKSDEELIAELSAEIRDIEAERVDADRRLRAALERLSAKHGGNTTGAVMGVLAAVQSRTAAPAPDEVRRISPRAKKEIDPKWFKVTKVCPHCRKEKNVGEDFGIIMRRGLESPSGWCKECRSKTSKDYLRKAPPKRRRR